jgi:type VI secretion system secreted protein VgrG
MALPGLGAHQVLKLKTKLGDDKLLVLNMEGREYLGRLPEYRIETVSNVDMLGENEDIDFKKVLGTTATLTLEVPGDTKSKEKRYFHSYVVRMVRGERKGRHERFTVLMRPWLYFLTRTKTSRIFQGQNVKDIIELVLKDYEGSAHEFRLAGTYPKLDYCVQYDETDFDFVSRLLEEAGICYFFEHEEEKHTMVMCDDMGKHKTKSVEKAINWSNALTSDSTVMNWYSQQELRSVQTVMRDHDYLASATAIEDTEKAKKPLSNKVGKMEVFEYPADAVQNQLKPEAYSKAKADTEQRAKVLMERLVSLQAFSTGRTNARDVAVGTTFEMKEEEGLLGAAIGALFGGGTDKQRKGTYLTVGANYRMEFAQHEAIPDVASMQGRKEGFVAEIVAISVDGAYFRPERSTPRPVIHGPQPALVVGAAGETSDKKEIDVDKHGRVKVKFYWDREKDVKKALTCWVRVMQPAAGPGYGMWVVPRIGHEVLVSFIEGNPDRPVIIGSVYNDTAMIAYDLTKQSTVSGWRTHSTEKGAADTANELRFDDKKDKEYLWLQAQNEFRRVVKKNAFDMVGENETVKVKMTRKEVIGENWYLDVGKDVMHNLGKDLHTKVAGDVFLTGGATYQMKLTKDLSAKVGGDIGIATDGKFQLKVTSDLVAEAQEIKMKGTSGVTIESTSKIALVCGASSIVLDPSGGIAIVGTPFVKINSGGGGGSAGSASPKDPTEAKVFADTKPDKATDYDKLFDDPIVTAGGKVGSNT